MKIIYNKNHDFITFVLPEIIDHAKNHFNHEQTGRTVYMT